MTSPGPAVVSPPISPTFSANVALPPKRSSGSLTHVTELDGVRGVAIILVLLRHWQQGWDGTSYIDTIVHRLCAPGWLGVELFFVLSGFLITRLLLQQRATASGISAYLRTFMWRRALRIFPLYYATLFCIFFLVPHLVPIRDPAYATLQHNARWYWLYGVNWLHAFHGAAAVPFNTAHFWSLAVEEQFYLAWPLIVWHAGPKRLPWVCAILWTASLVARVMIGTSFDPERGTTLLHLDPLMAGGLVAWYSLQEKRSSAERWLPLVALFGSVTMFTWLALYDGKNVLALAAISFGAVIAYLVLQPRNGGVARLLRSRLLRMFGTYSYCLYIVHYLLFIPLDRIMPRLPIPRLFGSSLPYGAVYLLLMVGGSLLIAAVSWRFFERPILALKNARWASQP